eukprot:CAMPEP_0119126064 /NCGR_PEP_ID=MMETSP1310-20130426/5128_1 /TAXON_ID=464262 /ORGANISM="Genus nov. species nov., Strain RCC2339" /LENGTH=209 /DNA_ID=CAMNT_0007116193 /DNA_START=48 /DNA_END=677 /DNA_ORIENTATION=+
MATGERKGRIAGLVPVFINLIIDEKKIRDVILWDPWDSTVSVSMFVVNYCRDLQVAGAGMEAVMKSMRWQIQRGAEVLVKASEHCLEWDAAGRPRAECIRSIFLDVTASGQSIFRDQFLWNIFNPDADLLDLVREMCTTLGIPRKYEPIISCGAIRQVMIHRSNLEHIPVGTQVTVDRLFPMRTESFAKNFEARFAPQDKRAANAKPSK